MRESRLSGSVEGVVCKHDSYSDFEKFEIHPRMKRVGLECSGVEWNRCGLGRAVLHVGQEVRPRASEEKGTEEVLPS